VARTSLVNSIYMLFPKSHKRNIDTIK
jgi:hypothetical protein